MKVKVIGTRRGAWTLLAVASLGCASAGTGRPSAQPALSAADRAAIEKARADSVRRPYTAADVEFMTNMIGHHAQALAISRWAATHGASRQVRVLAERIIVGQQDDIALMQQWLRERQKPVPRAAPSGRMIMNGVEHVHPMPGMLSATQLRALDEARGMDFDVLFLTFMIQHHRGAVAMVRELFSQTGAGQDEVVFRFASDVNVDQTTEIARMERMLAELQP